METTLTPYKAPPPPLTKGMDCFKTSSNKCNNVQVKAHSPNKQARKKAIPFGMVKIHQVHNYSEQPWVLEANLLA